MVNANLPMMGNFDPMPTKPGTSYFPPRPGTPVGGFGGFGGLGGLGGRVTNFLNSDDGSDMVRALGFSLMSSPRNHWLRDMGEHYSALRDDRRAEQKDQRALDQQHQEMEALVAFGVSVGVPEGEMRSLAANSSAAEARIQQAARERDAARTRQANSEAMRSIFGPDNSAMAPAATAAPADDDWAALGQTYGWATPQASTPPAGQQAPAGTRPPTLNDAVQAKPVTGVRDDARRVGFNATQAHLLGVLANPSVSPEVREVAKLKYEEIAKHTEPTPEMRNFAHYLTLDEQGRGDFREFRQSGSAQVNIGAGERAWDQESARLFAKRYDDITAGAMNAQQMLGMYDLAEQALNSGVRTGIGSEAELTLRQLGQAMGIDTDPDKLAGGELIRAIQNRMALTMRSPDGGMGMPGALSDRDIQFLKASQIGIDRSPEGNRRMLAAFRAMENRKVQIAQLADRYIEENGRLDSGFNRVVTEWAKANPLFEGETNTGQAKQVQSEAEYNALPSGTQFIAPDGTLRVKP